MARAVFVTGVVMKLILWAVIAFGLYLAVRALIDGHIGWTLLIVFVVIPVALWGASWVLSIANFALLYPLALVTGRRRELVEFNNFRGAAVGMAGADRLTLRASKMLLDIFEELPPPASGQAPRSGGELIALYNEFHPQDEGGEEEGVEPPKPEEPVMPDAALVTTLVEAFAGAKRQSIGEDLLPPTFYGPADHVFTTESDAQSDGRMYQKALEAHGLLCLVNVYDNKKEGAEKRYLWRLYVPLSESSEDAAPPHGLITPPRGLIVS